MIPSNPNPQQAELQQRRLIITQTHSLAKHITDSTPPLSLSLASESMEPNSSHILERGSYRSSIEEEKKFEQIEVQLLKSYRNSVLSRIDYEKKREVDSKYPDKIDKLNLMMEDRDKNEYERRQFVLEGNRLAGNNEGNIQIENYGAILVQSFGEWMQIKKRVKNQINLLKNEIDNDKKKKWSFFQKIFGMEEKDIPCVEFEKCLETLVDTSFFVTQNWHYENSQYRIICIHKNRQIERGHFYIYFQQKKQETKFQLQQDIPLNQNSAKELRRKLIIAYFSKKNSSKIQRLNEAYLQRTKANLNRTLILNNLNDEFIKPVPISIDLKHKQKISQIYPREAIADFISTWKNRAYFHEKNSKNYLYLEPLYIYIPKTDLAKGIGFSINSSPAQNFRFIGQKEDYFVFESVSRKIYTYDIEQLQKKEINFNVQVSNAQNRQSNYKNKISISNIENYALGFTYELALIPDNPSQIINYQGQFPYILVIEAAVKRGSESQKPDNLRVFRETNLLSQLGKIPNIYQSYYEFDYTPEVHPIVSQILTGTKTPISKTTFEQTYLSLLNFFQKEQNKSQNYCEFLKLKGFKPNQTSGFVMRDRYSMYCKNLSQINEVQANFKSIFSSGSVMVSKNILKKQLADLYDDLRQLNVYNAKKIKAILEKFIIYQSYSSKKSANVSKTIDYNSSLLIIADRLIQIYQRSEGANKSNPNIDQISIFFIAFIQAIYPYSSNNQQLSQDLLHSRLIVQKYLPQFNYFLNRKMIGLENLASSHFLALFTSLPLQLNLRIWDYLVINQLKLQQARLVTLYTILLFQQKTDLVPIFPINQILQSIHINATKLKVDSSAFFAASKVQQNYYAPTKNQQKNISKLAQQKYLRRFIYGKNSQTVINLTEDNFERVTNMSQSFTNSFSPAIQVPNNNIGELSYPLPTPGYGGSKIDKIYVFIGGVFLLGNLNMHSKQYRLQINLVGGSEIKDETIKDKSSFINKFVEFDLFEPARGNNDPKTNCPVIEFRLIESPNNEIMNAKLKLEGYHKDVVYRENVNLLRNKKSQRVKINFDDMEPIQEVHGFETSVICLSLALKSSGNKNQVRQNVQETNKKETEFYEKLLDFDLSSDNNEVIKSVKKLEKQMMKILDPLDQLDVQKYLNLRVSSLYSKREPEWVRNSKISIEEMKIVFTNIFSQESQKSIRLNFAQFYSNYAESYQKFSLGEFLFDLILMSKITKVKKLSMIFCICVHYQNIFQGNSTQKMSIETLNSIISSLVKSTSSINSAPFSSKFKGKITYGCYYSKGTKADENKKQITEILQDWAYICQLQLGYSGIILGSMHSLFILKSILPQNTIQEIQKDPLCRFEIHYEIEEQVYIWSSTVETQNFTVQRRGVKFLNNFPKYEQPGYQIPVAELMHNCENLIPLQSHGGIHYDQFMKIMRENSLVSFLLSQNQTIAGDLGQEKNENVSFTLDELSNISGIMRSESRNNFQRNKNHNFYTDFAIYRNQNFIPKWRKCKVIKDDGQSTVAVQFQNENYPDLTQCYMVPRYEVICMDENNDKMNVNTEFSESQNFSRA